MDRKRRTRSSGTHILALSNIVSSFTESLPLLAYTSQELTSSWLCNERGIAVSTVSNSIKEPLISA